MKIGIIDADLLGRRKHRFPNLVCEKLSGYWKEQGADVELMLEYNNFGEYDHVYISKVFTDTDYPEEILNEDNVEIGGTGFYFDKAPNLPTRIEHHMPDYSLYDDWIKEEVEKAKLLSQNDREFDEKKFMVQFKEYTDYSIGFLTRGCFRKCGFCVNKKYDHVFPVTNSLNEFFDESRKKLCFLDDNFLGCSEWKRMLYDILQTGRPFKFKQGLDERLLTAEKCKLLFNSGYDGDFTFAFDNMSDYELIHEKLKLIRSFTDVKNIKFYVLVGFDSTDEADIENAFKRIELLMRYQCLPYVMRYQNKNDSPWKQSQYRSMYVTIARWCN
jgi:radical SAM superfamily enzyme YgiQ (UPF0313 family)